VTEIRPLFIWGEPDMEKLKQVKESLGLDYLVRREQAGPGRPGITGRVLAFGSSPDFACDYALVRTVAGYRDALEWALGLREDSRSTRIAAWLSEVAGGKVTEVD
jgi:hypothetical protein